MIRKPKQMSESMILGVVLTLAGGFQDAYSYNCRGQVFANAQTGNIVLLGQNIASGNFQNALHYLFPLLAFLAGVYLSEWVRELCKSFQKLHWRQIVLAFEILRSSHSDRLRYNLLRYPGFSSGEIPILHIDYRQYTDSVSFRFYIHLQNNQ